MSAFDADELAAMRTVRTVVIETSARPGAPVHRTPIWVAVDEADRVLVRSVRGAAGRWYRELVANPDGALDVGGRRILFRAERATDGDRIDACSRAIAAKYASSRGSVASMLQDEILDTTLELRSA